MEDSKEKALAELQELSAQFNEIMNEIEKEQEQYWESLSKDDQLKVFCAVVRRIFKGEIELNGSYRYVLYDVFGFGPESYTQAQLAGYLSIHNSIFCNKNEASIIRNFCDKYNIENADEKIQEFCL